jgi:membrane protease YdiL (CAAX protease family)
MILRSFALLPRTERSSQVTASARTNKSGKKKGGGEKKGFGNDRNAAVEVAGEKIKTHELPSQEGTPLAKETASSQATFSRQEVLEACLKTTLAISAAGAGSRLAAQPLVDNIPFLDSTAVHSLLTNEVAPWHAAAVGVLVVGVTGGRLALISIWPDYRTASDRSNKMVLQELSSPDLLWVSFLPGFSEELLFSGALLPLLGADWKAVCLTGLIFGILHREGGRNLAFASWAAVVGWAYGTSYLLTHDILVPASAHSLANLAAAFTWRQSKKRLDL